jgi:hypothetical protein
MAFPCVGWRGRYQQVSHTAQAYQFVNLESSRPAIGLTLRPSIFRHGRCRPAIHDFADHGEEKSRTPSFVGTTMTRPSMG